MFTTYTLEENQAKIKNGKGSIRAILFFRTLNLLA